MEIKLDVDVPFPREIVYQTYRDRLLELLPFLPNIRKIDIKKREVRLGGVYFENQWIGGGDIPAAARAVLSESMLRWTDFATWKDDTWLCEWKTEVHAFPGAIQSSGTNRFVESRSGTKIEFRGNLVCDASRVPAVPRLLARTLNGTIEKIFVGKVGENLVAVGKGIGELLRKG